MSNDVLLEKIKNYFKDNHPDFYESNVFYFKDNCFHFYEKKLGEGKVSVMSKGAFNESDFSECIEEIKSRFIKEQKSNQ